MAGKSLQKLGNYRSALTSLRHKFQPHHILISANVQTLRIFRGIQSEIKKAVPDGTAFK